MNPMLLHVLAMCSVRSGCGEGVGEWARELPDRCTCQCRRHPWCHDLQEILSDSVVEPEEAHIQYLPCP